MNVVDQPKPKKDPTVRPYKCPHCEKHFIDWNTKQDTFEPTPVKNLINVLFQVVLKDSVGLMN